MKKLLIVISFIVATLIFFNAPVKAQTINEEKGILLVSDEAIYFENGDYIIIELYESEPVLTRAGSYNKTGNRYVTMNDSDGSIVWQYTLTGYFTVDPGVSVSCYNSSYSQYSNSSTWKFSNGTTSYSGYTAYGQGTFKNKVLFITIQTVNIDINVRCDVNGNIY